MLAVGGLPPEQFFFLFNGEGRFWRTFLHAFENTVCKGHPFLGWKFAGGTHKGFLFHVSCLLKEFIRHVLVFQLYFLAERSSRTTMKVIPLSEAKAQLSRYANLCHREPVVVTVNGKPAFQMVPLEEDDDLIERLIRFHPRFRKLLKARLKERSISAQAALKRL